MKAAIYQINSKYIHSSLAAWYLLAAARNENVECECCVLEGSINESEQVLFDRAVKSGADTVGFCTYIWNVDTVLRLAKRLKEHDRGMTVILGGPEVGYRAEDILKNHAYADYVISGEGEVPFARLLSALAKGDKEPRIDGVSMRCGSSCCITPPYEMKNDPPCPYGEEYLCTLRERISYIETSRGCPFSCAYCLSCVHSVRFFDLENAKRSILLLANSGSKTVKFVDRTFNADRKRAVLLFRFIIEKYRAGEIPEGVTFHFEIAGELVDGDTLSAIKDAPAGLFQFEIGVQSFNVQTLRAINRYTNTEKLCEVITELSSYGNAHIHTDLIAGLPYEGIESFKASYNRLYALGSHKIQLGFLKLLWGSDMREKSTLYPCEYEAQAPYQVKSTPWLSEDDIYELEAVERANDGIFFSGRFIKTAKYLMLCTNYDAYTLALILGRALYSETTPALDTLFDMLFLEGSKLPGVEPRRLRDVMLYDRISNNNSCVIPKSLKIKDSRLKRISSRINEKYPQKAGVRRCIGILYTEDKVIFADYENKHPVSGLYSVRETALGEILGDGEEA